MKKNGKRVAIFQSNYIPWKGYFDVIKNVDEFILFDVVQYAKKTWRNRNFIKSRDGKLRLTIPVKVKGKYTQAIDEVYTTDNHWRKKHWKSIQLCYQTADFFEQYSSFFEDLYLNNDEDNLSAINHKFIVGINHLLGIQTKITWAKDYDFSLTKDNNEAIIEMLRKAEASIFINGPTAQQYMTTEHYAEHGIDLRWMDYSGYPEYKQLHLPFVHDVSIIDLIFNTGPDALDYLKTF